MSREVKRVPLDFKYKLNEVYEGYINPTKSQSCPKCNGNGTSKEYAIYSSLWYGNNSGLYVPNPYRENARYNPTALQYNLNEDDIKALMNRDRLSGFKKGYIPTPKEVNQHYIKEPFGHDSLNQWIVIDARLKKLNLPSECSKCKGTGYYWGSKEKEDRYNNWVSFEPPIGEGYQIWETISEGSPVSPIFDIPKDLAEWMVNNDKTITKDTTLEQWVKFIEKEGYAPSLVAKNGVCKSGVEAY